MAGKNERAADCSDFFATEINKEVRETALFVEQELVRSAAVDKGTLRASFIASVGSATNEIEETPDKSGAATLSKAFNVIGGASQIKYPVIYIQNNQPYSYRIMETGYSDQTPPKQLSTIIQAAVNK